MQQLTSEGSPWPAVGAPGEARPLGCGLARATPSASSPAARWPGPDPVARRGQRGGWAPKRGHTAAHTGSRPQYFDPREADGQAALGPRPPSTPGPSPTAARAHRVQQLRLRPSRWCLGFNFCVALRKLPIITAAERKPSPSTAALQLCRLLRTAGAGLWPAGAGAGSTRFRSPALWPGRGVHQLSVIATTKALVEI